MQPRQQTINQRTKKIIVTNKEYFKEQMLYSKIRNKSQLICYVIYQILAFVSRL